MDAPPNKRDDDAADSIIGQNDSFVGSLFINDTYYPIVPQAFHELRVSSSIYSYLPTLRAVVEDPMGRLVNEINAAEGQSVLGDGAKIALGMGKRIDDDIKHRRFRVVSTPRVTRLGASPVVTINALSDAFKWFNGLKTGAINNTSAGAIEDMALECGVGVHTPHPTNDQMAWICRQQSYAQFATRMCLNGWASDESCMSLGMDVDRVLRYVDVSQLATERPTFTARYLSNIERANEKDDKTYITVMDVQVKTAGAANLLGGYSARLFGSNIKGEKFEHTDVDVVKGGNFLDVNTDVKTDVDLSKSTFMPLDAGNCHDNYAKAQHQNLRLGLMHKVFVDIYYEQCTDARLFDTMELDLTDAIERTGNNNYSGVYFVIAKAYGVNGGRYFEKLRLVSNSREINAKAKLI